MIDVTPSNSQKSSATRSTLRAWHSSCSSTLHGGGGISKSESTCMSSIFAAYEATIHHLLRILQYHHVHFAFSIHFHYEFQNPHLSTLKHTVLQQQWTFDPGAMGLLVLSGAQALKDLCHRRGRRDGMDVLSDVSQSTVKYCRNAMEAFLFNRDIESIEWHQWRIWSDANSRSNH